MGKARLFQSVSLPSSYLRAQDSSDGTGSTQKLSVLIRSVFD